MKGPTTKWLNSCKSYILYAPINILVIENIDTTYLYVVKDALIHSYHRMRSFLILFSYTIIVVETKKVSNFKPVL